MALDSQTSQKGADFFFAHLIRVSFSMEKDEAPNPIDVRLLGPEAIVFDAEMPADTIEQFGTGNGLLWGSDHEIKYGG